MLGWATESLPVSKFKATCLSVLQRVRRSGQPILLTRFGKPLAEVVPARKTAATNDWLGSMRGRGTAKGDLTKPVIDARDWAVLRD